jgi:transcriptional accessory protein Tex/SPT6
MMIVVVCFRTSENVDTEKTVKTTKGKKTKKKDPIEYLPEPLDRTWIHPESYHITHRYTCTLFLPVDNVHS